MLGDLRKYAYGDFERSIWWFRDWMSGKGDNVKKHLLNLDRASAIAFLSNSLKIWAKYAKYGYYANRLQIPEEELKSKLEIPQALLDIMKERPYRGEAYINRVIEWYARGSIRMKAGGRVEDWIAEWKW
jgi:hypothetical protein